MACFDALALDCALTAAGRIARVAGSDGTVSYRPLVHLRDHLGSVRAVVDGDTGSVIEAFDYYPFGKRIATAAGPELAEGSPSAAAPTVASAGTAVSSHTSKTGINDMFKVFKFASDKTKVDQSVIILSFKFADPENDVKDLKNGTLQKIQFVEEKGRCLDADTLVFSTIMITFML